MTQFAVVKQGDRLKILAEAQYRQFVKGLGDGEQWTLTLTPATNKRSSSQNRYYFGVVLAAISEHTGYEVDELHDLFAMKFLRIEDDPITGSPRRKRTPKCNTKEFAAYVEQVIRFAATELGVVIPDAERAA